MYEVTIKSAETGEVLFQKTTNCIIGAAADPKDETRYYLLSSCCCNLKVLLSVLDGCRKICAETFDEICKKDPILSMIVDAIEKEKIVEKNTPKEEPKFEPKIHLPPDVVIE